MMTCKGLCRLLAVGIAAGIGSGCTVFRDCVDIAEVIAIVTGGQTPEAPELAMPESLPLPSDPASGLPGLANVSADIDASAFPEFFDVSAVGLSGMVQPIGRFRMRALVAESFGKAVSTVFREPVPGEVPVIRIIPEITRNSALKTGPKVEAVLSGKIRLVWLDEDGFERVDLFSTPMEVRRTSEWSPGEIPRCVFDAINGMFEEFLGALAADRIVAIRLERAAAGWAPGDDTRRPEAPAIVAFAMNNGKDTSCVTGKCSVACNDWESTQTATWAKSRIFGQCADKLGLDKARVRVLYDFQTFDSEKKVWDFSFWALSRLPLAVQYSKDDRQGVCVADLELLGGDAAEAEKRAKAYVMQSMNHRAAIVADDIPEAKADVQFGDIHTDTRLGLLTLPFRLVY